jgi:hypothetical protein
MKTKEQIKPTMKSILLGLALLAAAAATHAQSWTNIPPQFWTPFSGSWGLFDGRMVTETSGQENWTWAGLPPIVSQGDLDARLKVEFASVPADELGRHGGIMFFASVATQRFDPAMNGYTVDWIDRFDDHGFRLYRWDAGWYVPLAAGTPALAEPPQLWQLEVRGDVIRFKADGQMIFEVTDATYRQGHFGIWAHGLTGVPGGNIQHLLVDDVQVGTMFRDNFDPPPVLNIQRLGGNVVLSWTNAAFGLQSAPAISGTFTNVPGATSPHTNSISAGQRFFRLIPN